MNWRLLVYLSFFGLAMALATVSFIPTNFELVLWIFVIGFSAYSVGKNCPEQTFMNGFILGIINTIYCVAFRIGFFQTYSSAHPELTNRFQDLSPMMVVSAYTVIVGIVLALLIGFSSSFVAKQQQKA